MHMMINDTVFSAALGLPEKELRGALLLLVSAR